MLKYILWEIINPFILWIKRNKKVKFNNIKYKGTNIGCGFDSPDSYLGVDGGVFILFKYLPEFVQRVFYKKTNISRFNTFDEFYSKISKLNVLHFDLKYKVPFRDNSVSNIFSSHFLEHLFYDDAKKILSECYRVLTTNGIIRICVPSLDDEILLIKNALDNYENKKDLSIIKYVIDDRYGFIDKYTNHKYMYNYDLMKKLLEDCGFKNIRQCKKYKGEIPDVNLLDTREGLFVEASK
jgi:SAM-dependent methyltransferase